MPVAGFWAGGSDVRAAERRHKTTDHSQSVLISNIEKLVVILTSVGLIGAAAVAHMPLHHGRVGCVTASAVEASLAEKNPRVPRERGGVRV
jgi:hypothetical protein